MQCPAKCSVHCTMQLQEDMILCDCWTVEFSAISYNTVLFGQVYSQVQWCETSQREKVQRIDVWAEPVARAKENVSFKKRFSNIWNILLFFWKAINLRQIRCAGSQLHSLVSLWKIRALSSNYSHNLKLKGYLWSKLFGIFIFEIFQGPQCCCI